MDQEKGLSLWVSLQRLQKKTAAVVGGCFLSRRSVIYLSNPILIYASEDFSSIA
jgi:hypothetical protein